VNNDYLPSDINEDEKLPVRGRLLAWLIEKCRANHWTTGWGLKSEKGANGGVISLDPNALPDDAKPDIYAKITGKSSEGEDGEYTAREVGLASDDTYYDPTEARVWDSGSTNPDALPDLICRQDIASLPVGMVVKVIPQLAIDGTWAYFFDAPGIMIPVEVEEDGLGVNGVAGVSAPTWTYTVRDKYSKIIKQEATPENYRALLAHVEGTKGYAYMADNGVWELGWINEEPIAADYWGYSSMNATNDATGAKPAGGIGGFASESGLAGAGGSISFSRPDIKSLGETWVGVSTFIENNAVGDDIVHQWADFSEIKDWNGVAVQRLINNVGIVEWEDGIIGGDGHGFEFVDHNDVEVGAETDNGRINFKDNGTTPTLPQVEVEWTITDDDANDTVDVEAKVDCTGVYTFTDGTTGTTNLGVDFTDDGANGVTAVVDFSEVSGYVASSTKQVLVNDNGTIKWVDTAECP